MEVMFRAVLKITIHRKKELKNYALGDRDGGK
jgi:hypothetical protein